MDELSREIGEGFLRLLLASGVHHRLVYASWKTQRILTEETLRRLPVAEQREWENAADECDRRFGSGPRVKAELRGGPHDGARVRLWVGATGWPRVIRHITSGARYRVVEPWIYRWERTPKDNQTKQSAEDREAENAAAAELQAQQEADLTARAAAENAARSKR